MKARGGRRRVRIVPVRSVRDARKLDFLDAAVWGSEDPGKHRHFEYFLHEGSWVFRAFAGGDLAGAFAVGGGTMADLMSLEEIMVAQKCRKTGVGTACLNYVRRLAKREGLRGVVAEVDIKNRRAMTWYKRNGFKVVGSVITDNETAWAREERVIRKAKGRCKTRNGLSGSG
jgi:ribosomal protein S18 acetylase RimI-like enzyme